jgi:hypothetical protein
MQAVTAYSTTDPAAAAPPVAAAPGPNALGPNAPPPSPNEIETARQQLDAASRQLAALLDENWKRYLALPPDIYLPNQAPNPQNIHLAVARYEEIARRPEYAALAARPEFQETRRLLLRLSELQQAQMQPLQLPPPPAR